MSCAICWEEDKHACKRPDHVQATLKRAARIGKRWNFLTIVTERGGRRGTNAIELIYGDRHHLDGQPIHCGAALELQNTDTVSDDFGEYTIYLNTGTRVRYEVEHARRDVGTVRIPVMYVWIAGHSFSTHIDAGHYFRWPERTT